MEDKPSYEIKSRKDLTKVPSAIAKIEDVKERLEAIVKAHKSFNDHEADMIAEHRKYDLSLREPGKGKSYEKMHAIYMAVDKEHTKNGTISASKIDNYLKNMAMEIMPHMFKYDPSKAEGKAGIDEADHAKTMMEHYLNVNDNITNRQGGSTLEEVKEAIANGNAAEAEMIISKAIVNGKLAKEKNQLTHMLEPTEMGDETAEGGKPYDFMLKASEYIKKDVESQIGPGTVSVAKIAKDIDTFRNTMMHYAAGNYAVIAKSAKAGPKKKVA